MPMSAAELAKISASLPNPDNIAMPYRRGADPDTPRPGTGAPCSDLIALGDLVRLKSGGPCMVVVRATRADVIEGQAFLGYPTLTLMAQRAEYATPLATITDDMTRKWMVIVRATQVDVTTQWFTEGELLHGTFLHIALMPEQPGEGETVDGAGNKSPGAWAKAFAGVRQEDDSAAWGNAFEKLAKPPGGLSKLRGMAGTAQTMLPVGPGVGARPGAAGQAKGVGGSSRPPFGSTDGTLAFDDGPPDEPRNSKTGEWINAYHGTPHDVPKFACGEPRHDVEIGDRDGQPRRRPRPPVGRRPSARFVRHALLLTRPFMSRAHP